MQGHRFNARPVVLSEEGLLHKGRYWLKTGSRRTRVEIAIKRELNLDTGQWQEAQTLPVNGIGQAKLNFKEMALFDAYADNQQTGSFIFIDPQTNNTVAAGMVTNAVEGQTGEMVEDALMTFTLPVEIGERLLNSDLFAAHRSEIRISRWSGGGTHFKTK